MSLQGQPGGSVGRGEDHVLVMPDWVKSWLMTFDSCSISFFSFHFFLTFSNCGNPNKNEIRKMNENLVGKLIRLG